MLDVLIKNVEIFDGTGGAPFVGCVGIVDGKICYVFRGAAEVQAAAQIDGTGLSLAPGFIDVHTHSDLQLFRNPSRWEKLKQGVTTEVGGQCGWSLAPFPKNAPKAFRDYLDAVRLTGPDFDTFAEAIDCLNTMELGTNQASFVGHGYLRGTVIGMEDRAPTAQELDRMRAMAEEAMQSGAMGLSSGLVYAPGIRANMDEIAALAKVAGRYNGIYTTHMRDEADRVVEAVEEALKIAEMGEVPLNISHAKAMFPENYHKVEQIMELVDKANARGMQVTFDVYPYAACSATILSTLPPSYLSRDVDWMVEQLQGKENVERLRKAIYEPTEVWENPVARIGVENILIAGAPYTPEAVGKRISEYAREKGLDGIEAYAEIIARNRGGVTDIRFSMSEENVEKLYQHDRCMVGTDGLYQGGTSPTHVRAFATFPRYLGHYIRDRKLLTFAEGVRRITGMSADVYGLKGKGYIKEGYDADLVLFDKARIIDKATYTNPFIPNEGICRVFVNGKVAVADNEVTDVREGKPILRSR